MSEFINQYITAHHKHIIWKDAADIQIISYPQVKVLIGSPWTKNWELEISEQGSDVLLHFDFKNSFICHININFTINDI